MSSISNYYDYAAATPILPEAVKKMEPYFSKKFFNPSALYLDAKNIKAEIENYRKLIASGLGAKTNEIIFTAGGTEANNLAVCGLLNKFKGSKVLYSAIEHDSLIKPASNYTNCELKVKPSGIVDLNDLQAKIDDNTVLVSVMYANNEIGTVQPISKIAKIIDNVRKDRQTRHINLPIYLHSDACQAANYLDLQVNRLGIDLMTINSGKIYGPKQCGALYIKTGVQINPIIYGGGQEKGLRSGTENVANIAGFATSFEIIRKEYKQEALRLIKIRDIFIKNVLEIDKRISLTGPKPSDRLANNIHISIDGIDNEWFVMMLDEQGFKLATGSACSASKDEASHVLKAIGLSKTKSQQSVRISTGRYTTLNDTNKLLKIITKTVAKQ